MKGIERSISSKNTKMCWYKNNLFDHSKNDYKVIMDALDLSRGPNSKQYVKIRNFTFFLYIWKLEKTKELG